MNRTAFLFIFFLSVASGFPPGRFDRARKRSYVSLFPVKKAFEVFQMYMDDLYPPGPLINESYLPKGDLATNEDYGNELPSSLSLLDNMKNKIPHDTRPEDLDGMKREIIHRVQKPWRNSNYIDNYRMNFRMLAGMPPIDIEDDFLS